MEKKQLRFIGKSRRTMVVVTNSIDLLFPIITETMYLLNMHLALPSSALFTGASAIKFEIYHAFVSKC